MQKILRAQAKQLAAEILFNDCFYEEAVTCHWHATREFLFEWLSSQKIQYNSTTEAIFKFLMKTESKHAEMLVFVETIGTLTEWDEYMKITQAEAIEFKSNCQSLINLMGYGEK